MKYTARDLKKHLVKEHNISPFTYYLKEIVYGGNDGIVTTFAVVAGFAGATGGENLPTISVMAVLLFGLANLFADGVSMGLGNILSVLSEKDIYRKQKEKEIKEIKKDPLLEEAETIHLLKSRGYDEHDAKAMALLYSHNRRYWVDFMMKQELKMQSPENENPLLTSSATFLAFIGFGFIPLIPYFVLRSVENTFLISILFTMLALVLLGLVRWKVTSERFWRSVGEVLLIGGASAAVAFFVGTFFRG
jgi:VIT1/CCC1 family predicted Fe2+/Mn2+ transporter